MSAKESATPTAVKTEMSPAVRKMAQERLLVLADQIAAGEARQVVRDEESRAARERRLKR